MTIASVIFLAFYINLVSTRVDNATQNSLRKFSESELYSELSIANDNICNNHEKNVTFDVILIDSKVPISYENETNHIIKKRQVNNTNNAKDYKDRPRADQKSLLIVFDGTGSMHDDLAQLRSGAHEIINDLSSREDSPIFNYVLVVFRDPNVDAPFETRNPDELLERLKHINVAGGADCPEMALSGLSIALKFALPNSLAYVFSDATAKDYGYYDDVIAMIQKKQVTVNFLLTGDCGEESSNLGYQVYHKISRVSNGQVYDMNKNNVKDVLLAIRHTVSHNYAALKSVDTETAGISRTDLFVDKSISELSVKISGKNPSLSIKNPANETVKSSNELSLKNLKLVSIKDPKNGKWSIEAGADSSHSLRLSAISDFKFEFGFSLDPAEIKSETAFQPLIEHKNILSIFVTDPSLIDTLSNVTIILAPSNTAESSRHFTIPLRQINDNVYATSSFDIPRQMFKIQLNGIDVDGSAFERLISTGLFSSEGTTPEVNIDANKKEVYENERLHLKCLVKSLVPVKIIWFHDEKALLQKTSNQSNELDLVLDNVTKGKYKCLAVNSIGNEFKEIFINVKSLPRVKIFKDTVEMMENVSYSLQCNIDGFEEGTASIVWLDAYGNFLQNGGKNYTFHAQADDHNKTIRCRVRTIEFTVEDSINLQILYRPKFLKTYKIENSISFGHNKSLNCETHENPKANLTEWFFIPKSSNLSVKIKQKTGNIFALSNVNEQHEGTYECSIGNRVGKAHRQFRVAVIPNEVPRVLIENDIVIVNETGSVDLSCECHNCLPLSNFTWIHDNLHSYEEFFIKNESDNSLKLILRIKNLTEDDNGSFHCQMVNKLGIGKASVELLVQTRPKIQSILLKDENMVEITNTLQVLEQKDVDVSFECVTDGFPEPSVYWRFKDEKIEDSIIKYKNISRQNSGIYECVVENILGKVSRNFTLVINFPPEIRKHQSGNLKKVTENSNVTLSCEFFGNPQPEIEWLVNSRKIVGNEKYQTFNANKDLSFVVNGIDDSGIYTCNGKNEFGSVSYDSSLIVITFPVILSPKDEIVKIKVNSPIKIACDAIGFPQPQVRFIKDNIILSYNGSLELERARENDSGAYHCIAENEVGFVEKIFYVTIVDSPQITSKFANITLFTNQSKEILCEAKAIPMANIFWKDEHEAIVKNGAVLTVTSTTREGKYTCVAENSEGIDAKYFHLYIINFPTQMAVAESLQKIISIRENEDLELLCPYDGITEIRWTFNDQSIENLNFEYKQIHKKLLVFNTSRIHHGNFTCYASNAAGNASFSYDISIQLSPIVYASWNLNDRVSDFLYTESDIDEKVFKLGESLTLNCTADGIPEPKVLWRKSGDIINEGEILSIKNLQFHHSDIYTCSAGNSIGTVKKFFKVDVISAPFKDDSIPSQTNYQKSIGDSIILRCSVIANPLPLFFWFKDNEIMDDKTDDHLEIDELKVTDNGVYRCLAKNKIGSVKIDFHINIFESAQITIAEEDKFSQTTDGFLKLSCTSRGSPLPIVSWIMNGHILSSTSKLNIEKLFKTVHDNVVYFDGFGNEINYLNPFNIKLSKQKVFSQLTMIDSKTLKLDLIFKNREKLSTSKYVCYSFNALGRDEKSVEVIVTKKPHVKEGNKQRMHDQEILEHLPLLLACLIDGVPEPKIKWYKNGMQIYENETIKFLNGNKFLSIAEAYSYNSGNYSCVGENHEGAIELKSQVSILSPPKLIDYSIQNVFHNDLVKSTVKQNDKNVVTINVRKGDDAVLECWIESFPKSKIHWIRFNIDDDDKNNELLNEGGNVLTRHSIQEPENFMCYGNNTLGNIQKLFYVIPNFAPIFIGNGKTEEFLTVNLHHGINLDCRVKAFPEAITNWHFNSTNISKYDNDFFFTNDNHILRIVNANKNHEGKFICTSTNKIGSVQKVLYVKIQIPIQYTLWTEWSSCSKTCGNNGVQYRSRKCILLDESPSYNCSGENMQMRKCNEISCPVDGGWSLWSKWSSCPKCYDENESKPRQKRQRKCDSPIPAFGGIICEGLDYEERECVVDVCAIDGNWSNWSSWSSCSATCGRGFKTRKRHCNNPPPKHNGKLCKGENVEYEECKNKLCNNYNLRKTLDRNEIVDSTENYGELAEFEIKNEDGQTKVYKFMQHREIEYSPPRHVDSHILPKFVISLDTYKPISEETYVQHIKKSDKDESDQVDDYFETELLDSTEIQSLESGKTTTEKNCGKGFKYNSNYNQCEEINECSRRDLNSCKIDENCINTIGSYRCEKLSP